MDRNNSSSAEVKEDFNSYVIDDEVINEEEFRKLEYDNFQLRLRCYNYEKFISDLQNCGNNQKDLILMKKELCEKTQQFSVLEEELYQTKIENCKLKNDLGISEREGPLLKEVTIQCDLNSNLEYALKSSEQESNRLLEQLSTFKEENSLLKESLNEIEQKMNKSVKNAETFIEIFPLESFHKSTATTTYNNTDIILSENLDTSLLNECLYDLKTHLDTFMELQKTDDIQIQEMKDGSPLESTAVESSEIEATVIESITSNNWDGINNFIFLNETPCCSNYKDTDEKNENEFVCVINECQKQIVDDEVNYLLDKAEMKETLLISEFAEECPLGLTMNKLFEEIKNRSTQMLHIGIKVNQNQKYCKTLSSFPLVEKDGKIVHQVPSITYDFNIIEQKINNVAAVLHQLLPYLKNVFSKTLHYLKAVYNEEPYLSSILQIHTQNERILNDYSETCMHSISYCLDAMNRQILLLNGAYQTTDINEDNSFRIIDKKCKQLFEQMIPTKEDKSVFTDFKVLKGEIPTQTEGHNLLLKEFGELNKISKNEKDILKEQDGFPLCKPGFRKATSVETILPIYSSNIKTLQAITCKKYFIESDRKVLKHECLSMSELDKVHEDIETKLSVSCCDLNNSNLGEKQNYYKKSRAHKFPMTDNENIAHFSSPSQIVLNNNNDKNYCQHKANQNSITPNRHRVPTLYRTSSVSSPEIDLIKYWIFPKSYNETDLKDIITDLWELPITKTEHCKSKDVNDILNYLKLRMLKLILVHDLRRYIQALSKNDAKISDEYDSLTEQIMKHNFLNPLDSLLYKNALESLKMWRNDVNKFQAYIHKHSTIPTILLEKSDAELIQLLFLRNDSKLDFTLFEDFDTPKKSFNVVEDLIEELSKQYQTLENFYYLLMEKKHKLLLQFQDYNESETKCLIEDLNIQLSRLKKENEKLEHQLKIETVEFEKLTYQNANENLKSSSLIQSLTKDIDDVKEKLDATLEENYKMKEQLKMFEKDDDSLEKLKIMNVEFQQQIENLKISIANKISDYDDLLENFSSEKNEKEKLLVENKKYKGHIGTLNCKIKELEKTIDNVNENEKNLLLQRKQTNEIILQNQNKINDLCKIRDDVLKQLKDSHLELKKFEEDKNDNIKEITGLKEVNQLLENEKRALLKELNDEKYKTIELVKEIEDMHKNIIAYEDKVKTTNKITELFHEKVQEGKFYSRYIDAIGKKVDKLIYKLMDFYKTVDPNYSQDEYKRQFDVSPNWLASDSENVRKIKAIDVYLRIVILGIHQKTKRIQNRYLYTNEGDNLLTSRSPTRQISNHEVHFEEKMSVGLSNIVVTQISEKHSEADVFKKPLTKQDQSYSPYKKNPVPRPRNGFINNFKGNKIKTQRNRSNHLDDSDENIVQVLSDDDTSIISQSQKSFITTYDEDKSTVLVDLNDDTVKCIQNKVKNTAKDWNTEHNQEKLEDNTVDVTTSPLPQNSAYQTKSEQFDMNSLISTNRDLTQNLINTTNNLQGTQRKTEILNLELRRIQSEKHDLCLELKAKYEKIKKLEEKLEYKTKSKNASIQTNDTSINYKRKSSTFNAQGDQKPVLELDMLASSVSEIEHSINTKRLVNDTSTSVTNTTLSNHKTNDWDDVTRTMIRCLATLSDVQESLTSPPIPTSTRNRNTSGSNICAEFDDIDCLNAINSGLTSKDVETVEVVIFSQQKFALLVKMVAKIQQVIHRLIQNKDEMKEEVRTQIKCYIKKIFLCLNENHKPCLISHLSWESLNQTQLPKGTVVAPKHITVISSNELLSTNALQATDRLQEDILKLRQKLIRYQNRYKALKDAVLSNKYHFKNTDHTFINIGLD